MPKVLIIEDRRENIVFIANNILKPMGYEVVTAMDGQAGLAKAVDESPDLIISDLKLPGLGGLEVLEQLRSKGLNIPTIVMTFHGSEETAVRALRLGARDYLIKPFTIEEMQAALERVFKLATPPKLQPLPSAQAKDGGGDPAKMAKLEQEVAQLRQALVVRDRQINQMQQILTKQANLGEGQSSPIKPTHLDEGAVQQELAQLRNSLAIREKQVVYLQQQLANAVKKLEVVEAARRAATHEEDKAQLNQMLAETKQLLAQAEKRAKSSEELVLAQKTQLGKSQEEARRLADQLRHVSEAVRLLAQDLGQQVERMGVLSGQL
jgi:DNA-binding response OmpR family regulator